MPRHIQRTPEQIAAFKQAVADGKTLKEARLAAGYSPSASRLGKTGLPKELLDILTAKLKPYARIGRSVTPEEQEAIVRGVLLTNAAEGKDSAVNSVKLLGQDRRVNMFTPDNISGLIVLQVPQSLRTDALDLPSLEAEVVKSLPEKT